LSYRLTEISVGLIITYLQANIAAELSSVATQRADGIGVETPITSSYFIYPKARGYRPPAIFVIAVDNDFRLNTGPNFVNSLEKINVAVMVEDKDRTRITKKAWRYQAALTRLLNGAQITSSDSKVKIITKLVRDSFSPLYNYTAKDEESPEAVFRKEYVVELEVEHYENI
jgi:hypothetical protein